MSDEADGAPGVVRFLLFLGLAAGIAGGATWGFNTLWRAVGDGEMSLHGWIALGLGIAGAFGLAWLLMTLAFHSDSEGWDDRVDNSFDPGREDEED
ncbi:hypothetical protein [Brevundimonas sp.]|uniref:hypothetical protein n=1 Tax=Brevundimonas sp. TaxID=1871086 RepID=UPI0025BFE5F5|nr:hypothetical protein [Brevundimonas sp.]